VFATLAGAVFFFGVLTVVARETWRQTSPANLESRGINADERDLPVYDPGLRKNYQPMLPFGIGIGRQTSAPRVRSRPDRAARQAGQARPVGPVAMVAAAQARRGPGRQRSASLGPDATVNFGDERRASGIDEVMAALDTELIGLEPVKQKLAEIGSLLVDRARKRFGLSASRPNLHMSFTGAPGTGKTTVALMTAGLLRQLGYLERAQLVHAMRDDLVGEFIGQTAPKTKRVLERATGGVLFIDEACSLYRADDSRDYGQECIDILMQVMENQRDSLVVLLAGYKDRMDGFFDCNPGMNSRIAHHLDFAGYQTELLEIGQLMLGRSSYYLSAPAAEAFRYYLSKEQTRPSFAHGRSVRNALERARLQHAHRLAAEPERLWSKDDLMRLEPADILGGTD
jgi:probable Rubsico expression protein CbbX